MEDIKELENKFASLFEELKDEFSTIRTNRPTGKLVENIPVNYNETTLPIKQLGSISIEVPRDIVITPWDKEVTTNIAKGINEANLGVSVAVQGLAVRVTLPELTSERREELGRIVRKTAEEIRIKMRTLRDDVHKKVNVLSDEDEKFRMKDQLQKAVDKFNSDVEKAVETKLQEIAA